MGGSYKGNEFDTPNAANTAWAKGQLMNATNFGRQGMQGVLAGLTANPSDPNSIWGQFTSFAPQLQGLVQGSQSDLQRSLTARAGELARESGSQAASQLAGLGGLYSGATIRGVGDANARAFGDVANQLGAQQINLTGSLFNNALSTLPQTALGAAGLYGNIYGQGLQGITAFGEPQYVQKRYEPGFFESGGLGSGLLTAGLGGASANLASRFGNGRGMF